MGGTESWCLTNYVESCQIPNILGNMTMQKQMVYILNF